MIAESVTGKTPFDYERSNTRPWVEGNVALAHGTKVRMRYGKQSIEGRIVNGQWQVGKKIFPSPSTAASQSVKTGRGRRTRLNGWLYWEVYVPAIEQWLKLDQLRS